MSRRRSSKTKPSGQPEVLVQLAGGQSSLHVASRDLARCSRGTGVPGLEVFSAHWFEHSFAPHLHDFYAVSLNEAGRGTFDCRRRSHDARPGTCNLIAPGDVHTGRATSAEGWTYRNLHLEGPLMATLLAGLDWRGPAELRFQAALVQDPVLAGRLRRVFTATATESSRLEIESLLLAAVARLVTHHLVRGHALSEPAREHAAVERVREFLDASCEENVSIRALADLAHLSPHYLVRAFHRHVGVPPHHYQRIARAHRARRLLRSGATLADVALRTGFCDQSHLNRVFKRTFGVTPGSYAAAETEGRLRPIAS